MGKAQIDELLKHGSYISVPSGISMRPMIYGHRDAVLIKTLNKAPKRYDLVMYLRPNGQGVIHRVIKRNNEKYIICGDNCWQLEYVAPEQIKGIVTKFNRRGRWHTVNELGYIIYVHLIVDLLFIKRPIYYIRDRIRRLKK